MKKIIYIATLFILFIQATLAESPCAPTTGNVFRRTSISPGPGRINVALNENCAAVIPDFRSFYQAMVTHAGWRVDSITQSPAIGTTIYPLSAGSCPDGITRSLTMRAYFRNTRHTSNPRDDQFCIMTIADTLIFQDKLAPVARVISFATSILSVNPASLKNHFGSDAVTDNCSSLSVLQGNLEFSSTPPYPSEVTLRCNGRNVYAIRYRTRDQCGNYSNWSLAIITFTDHIAPVVFTLISPAYLFLDGACTANILRSQIRVSSADDLTPSDQITLSYRVIAPLSLAGNILSSGKLIDAHGLCAPDNRIVVRVCAQDCFGNGDLHVSDNGISENCNSVFITLKDTIKPSLTGTLSPRTLSVSPTTCTVEMPNVASLLSGLDNCSDVSIYQLPAPGSILNDGNQHVPGLARGIPRSSTCELMKEPDDQINCVSINGPIIKTISVSFLIIDCHGNCAIRRFPDNIQLTNIPIPTDVKINNSLNHASYQSPLNEMYNYPNPFNFSTIIHLENEDEAYGELKLYSIDGKEITRKPVSIQKGITNIPLNKNELNNYTGIAYYRLESQNRKNKEVMIRMNKMVIH